jgi:hypothetical protein
MSKIYSKMSIAILGAMTLISCSTGNNTESNSTSNGSNYTAIPGPLNYDFLTEKFTSSNSHNIVANVDFSLGSVIMFAPEVAPLFGPIQLVSNWINVDTSGKSTNARLAANFNGIQAQISSLQQNIASLQQTIQQDQLFYQRFVNQTDNFEYYSAYNNVSNAWEAVSHPNSNTYGLWEKFQSIIGSNINAAAINPSIMTALQNFSQYSSIPGDNVSLASLANELSMSTMNTATISNSRPYLEVQMDLSAKKGGDNSGAICSGGGGGASGMVSLLACQFQFLRANLPQAGIASKNLTPLLDAYNNNLFHEFQQNLSALQTLYSIEAYSSYLNYQNFLAYKNGEISSLNQILPYENTTGIFFSVGAGPGQLNLATTISATELQSAFSQQQTNLMNVYAARINSLYDTMMSFIISDPQVTTQSYTPPPQNFEINNKPIILAPQSDLYKTIPAATLSSTVNGGYVPGGNILTSNGLYYQYSGINQLYSCAGPDAVSVDANGVYHANVNKCISAFPSSSGFYDGESMIVYFANAKAPLGIESAPVLNNISDLCDVPQGSNSLNNPISLGVWNNLLVCNAWQGTKLISSLSYMKEQNDGILPVYDPYNPNHYFDVWWMGSGQPDGDKNLWYNMATNMNANSSYTYALSSHTLSSDFQLIASTVGEAAGVSTQGNFYVSGSGKDWTLHDGGLPSFDYNNLHKGDTYVTHGAYLTVTLPNGYSFPFYIYTYQALLSGDSAGVYTSPFCVSSIQAWVNGGKYVINNSIPGIDACWQQDNGNGGLAVRTTDGKTYFLNVTQPSKGQGYQYGYLDLETQPREVE